MTAQQQEVKDRLSYFGFNRQMSEKMSERMFNLPQTQKDKTHEVTPATLARSPRSVF